MSTIPAFPVSILKHSGIDPMDVKNKPMLENLQGNILKGHGRDHTTHIFLHFDATRQKAVKKFLKEFAEKHITSCYKQLWERDLFKRKKVKGGLFANALITQKGFEYLDIVVSKDEPKTAPNFAGTLNDEAFKDGMKNRAFLQDPKPEKLEAPYREEIHAMLLLADDDTTRMAETSKMLLDKLEKFSRIVTIEYGHAIKNANGDGLEHNGYVDGISQPLFLKDEIDEYIKFNNLKSQPVHFDPSADPNLVLISDPLVNQKDCYGSYFVFRKLEQDVFGFKKAEEIIGKKMYPNDKDEEKREIAGAMLVGRFEDGTPVLISDKPDLINSGNINNFDYSSDPSGGKCPHFAHIRKTNTRPLQPTETAPPVMARRGIPFGHRDVDAATDPTHHQLPKKGVGLLFMSYQASLENQFEVIQKGLFGEDPDPLLGITSKTTYKFPNPWDTTTNTTSDFNQFIIMKGGEYFYAPSIPFFENL